MAYQTKVMNTFEATRSPMVATGTGIQDMTVCSQGRTSSAQSVARGAGCGADTCACVKRADIDSPAKVERVRKTAMAAFRPTVDLNDPQIETRLAACPHVHHPASPGMTGHDRARPHDSPGGPTHLDRRCDLIRQALTGEELAAAFDPDREFILPRDLRPAPRPRPG